MFRKSEQWVKLCKLITKTKQPEHAVPALDNGFIFFPLWLIFLIILDNRFYHVHQVTQSNLTGSSYKIMDLKQPYLDYLTAINHDWRPAKSPNIIGSCCKAYKFLMSYTLRWSHIYHQPNSQPYKFSKHTHILESHKTYI